MQATFTLEVNEWNGVSEPRLVLRRRLRSRRAVDGESRAGGGGRGAAHAPAAAEAQELVLFAL